MEQHTDDLASALAEYRLALDNLSANSGTELSSRALAALIARDQLGVAIAGKPLTAGLLSEVTALDQTLKADAPRLVSRVGRDTLGQWRDTAQPLPGAWWWSLDAQVEAPRPSPVWAILAGLFITISISLAAEISQRFLSVGADFVGVFSTLSQAILALLAGSALTDAGQRGMERFLEGLRVKPQHYPHWKLGLAFGLLALIVAFRLSLPAVSRLYNDYGVRQQAQMGDLSGAIESYQRAISLNPDDAESHYNLATAYEDVLQYDKAITEYQTVILSDPHSYIALNNLARLYLRRGEFNNALGLLDSALMTNPQDARVQYSLYKNRGWANLGLVLPGLAEADLRQAIALRADGGAAYCLLGQVLEKKSDQDGAAQAWEDCVRYEANDRAALEPSWVNLARERLAQSGGQ